MTITLYSKPSCGSCVFTESFLKKAKLDYDKVMITQDEDAADYVNSLGYQQAPVVVVHDDQGEVTDHWSGFSETKLKTLVA